MKPGLFGAGSLAHRGDSEWLASCRYHFFSVIVTIAFFLILVIICYVCMMLCHALYTASSNVDLFDVSSDWKIKIKSMSSYFSHHCLFR